MLNQLSGWPDFSSICSHRPAAVASPLAGAAHAGWFNAKAAPIVIEIRSFIATSISWFHPTHFMAGDCGDLPAKATAQQVNKASGTSIPGADRGLRRGQITNWRSGG